MCSVTVSAERVCQIMSIQSVPVSIQSVSVSIQSVPVSIQSVPVSIQSVPEQPGEEMYLCSRSCFTLQLLTLQLVTGETGESH